MAREAESVKNPLWNLSHKVLVMAANVSITNLTVSVIGHVIHAHWKGLLAQNWAHTSQSIGGNPQNELRAHRKAMPLTHNLCIQVISKSALLFSTYHLYLKLSPTWQNYFGFLWTGWRGGWNIREVVEGEADRWEQSEPLLASVKAHLALCHMYTKFHWVLI